jgi:peptidoglycan/LPS O-acetylase OafA/YrhL
MVSEAGRRFGDGEIRAFTGLRGCAAVLVMLYHFTLNMPPGTLPMRRFLLNGYLWVDLFFVLSGFVMAWSQSTHFQHGPSLRRYRTFLLSRIARIYPLYLLVLIESACGLAWRTPHLDLFDFWRTLLLNVFMVQAWGLAPSLEGSAWSISTEWGAYLVFPVLLSLTVLGARRVAWITGVAAFMTILWLALSPGPFTLPGQARGGPLDIYSSETAAPLLRCVAEFILGLLAFRLARHIARTEQSWTVPVATGILAAIVFAMCWQDLDALIVVLFFALLVTMAPRAGPLDRVLGSSVPYLLGQWSYSIYLIHDKFSHPAGVLREHLAKYGPVASVAAVAITTAVVLTSSFLTFTCIERPLRQWLNRKFREPLAPRPPVVAEFHELPERAGNL